MSREELVSWREFFRKLGLGSNFEQKKSLAAERVAILVAFKYEVEKRGVSKHEVHELAESEARGRGYDIESRMPDGSPRYIEVKGSAHAQPEIVLTSSQYRKVTLEPDKTFIYVITNALKDPELHVIPGGRLKDLLFEVKLEYSRWSQAFEDRWSLLKH